MTGPKPTQKPLLRGYFHQEAFFVALGACVMLVTKSTSTRTLIASGIYSLGLLLLFGISAIYHRPHWEAAPRALLKRFDHSAIFTLIAGTFTPLCLLALPETLGYPLLKMIWGAALVGIGQSIFWVRAPKWFTAVFYVLVGWLVFPYLGELRTSLGQANVALILTGGIVYTIGAVFYALKRPNFNPAVFGYHELFHIFTIVGAAFHFAVIDQLIH